MSEGETPAMAAETRRRRAAERDRLAEALRLNLIRRKQQMRARDAASEGAGARDETELG